MKYIRKRKRKKGDVFVVDIPYKDQSKTKHFTKTISTNALITEKQALQIARKIRDDALQKIQDCKLSQSLPTVGFLYEQKWTLMPLSSNTKLKQDAIYRHAIKPYENTRLDKIEIADIQLSLNQFAETHSADQINRLLSIWKSLYKCASILGYECKDCSQLVIVPKSRKVSKKRNQTITVEDFKRILDYLTITSQNSHRDNVIYNMLMIMYYTGCRPAEVLALTSEDIHDTYISINKMVGSSTKQNRQIVPVKTALSERRVPVPVELSPLLCALKKRDTMYLLSDEKGRLYDITRLSDRILDISRNLNIDFHAYMLRHLMSTELIQSDPVAARDILGHSSFGMTLDYARSTAAQRFNIVSDRSLVEKQPKNLRHGQPRTAIQRQYALMKLTAAIRLVYLIKCDI